MEVFINNMYSRFKSLILFLQEVVVYVAEFQYDNCRVRAIRLYVVCAPCAFARYLPGKVVQKKRSINGTHFIQFVKFVSF